MTVIQCCDLSLGYEGKCVLSHLELSVQEGDYLAIVGENGAGKSTLMKILSGVYEKDSGMITFDGAVCEHTSPIDALHRGLSIIYQELSLIHI